MNIPFEKIIWLYFSGKSKAKVKSHRQIYNSNMSDDESGSEEKNIDTR